MKNNVEHVARKSQPSQMVAKLSLVIVLAFVFSNRAAAGPLLQEPYSWANLPSMTWSSNSVNPGSGTLEWTYSNINSSEFDELWWTPQQLGVGLSGAPDDQLFSNLSGGIATYAGITTWLDPDSGSPGHIDNVNTRIIVEILGHSLTNSVPVEITSANLTPGTFAFAIDVSGLTEFTATFRVEAQGPHTGIWAPVNDFNQFPSPGGQTSSSVGGMFFRSAPTAETPVPATLPLIALGLAGLCWTRRRNA